MENIGAATGFPFGHYHFEVGSNLIAYRSHPDYRRSAVVRHGIFSWIVAGTLAWRRTPAFERKVELIALPVVAAFVMTQWDVVMDPPEATISKAWIWHDGGAHFGVPLSNYLGWLLTSWLFYQAFALYLSRRRDVSAWTAEQGRALRLVGDLAVSWFRPYPCDAMDHRPKRRGS